MRHPTLRKWLWWLSRFFAAFCLLAPPLMACGHLLFPAYIPPNPYTVSAPPPVVSTALANVARILGTGAALTLLATAADREIEKVTARDVLRKLYPGLISSYGAFFVLVFFASITGDCGQMITAAFSTAGAVVLAVWFFKLSLILLLDTKGQCDMAFGYYMEGIVDPKTTQDERMVFLQEAVCLIKAAPLCWDSLCCVFYGVLHQFSGRDEASKGYAIYDMWAEVNILTGVEMMEAAWATLWQANDPRDRSFRFQADMICQNILTDASWEKTTSERAILLAGLASFWLPWEKDCTYTEACVGLKGFCNAQRARNKGSAWSEQIISELACAFGMVMAVSLTNRSRPSWVDEEDLITAWRLFASTFQSSVFAAVDDHRVERQAELTDLLYYMEWVSRKRLRISWVEYKSDCRDLIIGEDPRAKAVAAEKLTNIRLLEILTSKYIRR